MMVMERIRQTLVASCRFKTLGGLRELVGWFCYCIFFTLKTGYFGAILSNAESGASLLSAICGRAPGARCKEAFKIGARWLTSTSSRRMCSVSPCRSLAFPPAVFTFRTQFVSSPFQVQPRRWMVERTIAWLNRCRRLSKDFEHLAKNSVAWSIGLRYNGCCAIWRHHLT